MNIKKNAVFFSIFLGAVILINIIGVVIGIVIKSYDLLFILSLLTMLITLLIFVIFIQKEMKVKYANKNHKIVTEQKNISLLVLGVSFILFIFSIILSYV